MHAVSKKNAEPSNVLFAPDGTVATAIQERLRHWEFDCSGTSRAVVCGLGESGCTPARITALHGVEWDGFAAREHVHARRRRQSLPSFLRRNLVHRGLVNQQWVSEILSLENCTHESTQLQPRYRTLQKGLGKSREGSAGRQGPHSQRSLRTAVPGARCKRPGRGVSSRVCPSLSRVRGAAQIRAAHPEVVQIGASGGPRSRFQ